MMRSFDIFRRNSLCAYLLSARSMLSQYICWSVCPFVARRYHSYPIFSPCSSIIIDFLGLNGVQDITSRTPQIDRSSAGTVIWWLMQLETRSRKLTGNGAVLQSYDFLSVVSCHYIAVSYRFRDIITSSAQVTVRDFQNLFSWVSAIINFYCMYTLISIC